MIVLLNHAGCMYKGPCTFWFRGNRSLFCLSSQQNLWLPENALPPTNFRWEACLRSTAPEAVRL